MTWPQLIQPSLAPANVLRELRLASHSLALATVRASYLASHSLTFANLRGAYRLARLAKVVAAAAGSELDFIIRRENVRPVD
jgi:hypothetical protein